MTGRRGRDLPVDFSLSIRSKPSAIVVQLGGELDLATYHGLERALAPAVASGSDLVVLDLGRLEFMDVSGLRALMRARQRAESAGKQLVLAAPPAAISRLLTLTRQEQAFRIYRSVAEAIGPERA